MNRYAVGCILSWMFILMSAFPAGAATIEIAAGVWHQSPNGSVAYTYNVLDVMGEQARDIVDDLLPFDGSFLERLSAGAPDLYHRDFSSTSAGRALSDLFTRTDKLDFTDDCSFEPAWRFSGRCRILVSPFMNFSFSATPLEFEGTGNLEDEFYFLDILFDPAMDFHSRLKLTHYDVAWFADLSPITVDHDMSLHTEIGLNVRIVDFHAGISQPDTGLSASTSSTVPLPMLYMAMQLADGDAMALEFEARGTRYSDDYVYDLTGRFRYHVTGPLHLSAGFRHLYVDLDIVDIDAEGTFSGPFVETVLIF